MTRILILLASLFLVGNAYALPPCPPDVFHNCYGTYTWADGSKYVGEWKDGKQHGQGTYTFGKGKNEGDKYVGEHKDHKFHGQGTYTDSYGRKHVGEFKNGEHWNGRLFIGETPIGVMSNGERKLGSTAYDELPRNYVVEWIARYFKEGEDGIYAYFRKTKEAALADIKESDKERCIDDASFFSICLVEYYNDVVVNISEAGGIFVKDIYVFFEERYIGSRHEIIGSRFFAEAFDRQIRKAKILHPEIEFHLEILRDDQITVWVGGSLELVSAVIASSGVGLPDNRVAKKSPSKILSTGTGFVVNKNFVVTAEHVLEKCNAVSIAHAHEEVGTQTVARDKRNDLGLLRLEKPMANTAKLRGSPDLRVGDAAINYGYPLFGELSDSAKLNAGYVNSLAGYDNDSGVIQYSAPTQPGNSGGPVLDQAGNVIGVVSSGLSKRYAEESGHIAQNVNFAIKSTILEGFLKANNVPFEKADSTEKLELPEIAEKAETFTVLVGCWE
jgi:S1-C subfamily serine protease